MKKVYLAFYWHMHQPYYYNPSTGASTMPWVRMHAMKGYLDLVSLLDDYPHISQTFNYVPSLLKQIEAYNTRGLRDIFLEHSAIPAADLSEEGKQFILWNFFMVNWDTMLNAYPRYKELLYKRGTTLTVASLGDVAHRFAERDMRDLQVWFNLAWFGFRACALYPEIKEMKARGAGFTEEDKARVLTIQSEILTRIVPLHRHARERGQIELTTSPFYHPIMPLLYDSDIARRAMPDVALPHRFHYPSDVEAQLAEAVTYHEKIFGQKPCGLWPSEGSVCPEVVPLAAKQGIRWMASDEEVLFRSLHRRDRLRMLYTPYRVIHGDASVDMVFRDRDISDRIGFTYASNDARSAVTDFVARVESIAHSVPQEDALVNVILDGENPWQGYPDGGEEFLRRLYDALGRDSWAETVRVGDYLAHHPPVESIENLYSGSWIDCNYSVWIGEEEDNAAWNLLGSARETLRRRESSVPAKILRAAREEIYAAEGSDWFWWYGDRFSSDNDEEFDELFRTHLRNVYTLLGEKPPDILDRQIINMGRAMVSHEPKAFLKPVIDGRESSYYEWVDAGRYSESRSDSTMCKTEVLLQEIMYGFDERTLYLRIDFAGRAGMARDMNYTIHLQFTSPRDCRLAFSLEKKKAKGRVFSLSAKDASGRYAKRALLETIAIDRIIELAVSFRDLGFAKGEEICFYVQVKDGELELERHPPGGYISLSVPDEDFEIERWNAS